MDATSRECTTNNGDDGSNDQRPASADSICDWTAAESTNCGAKEEEGVAGTEDVVRVACGWAYSFEFEVLVESRLAYRLKDMKLVYNPF
jgi:hypothetical protein